VPVNVTAWQTEGAAGDIVGLIVTVGPETFSVSVHFDVVFTVSVA
jgi:hypothetical protein